MSHLFLVLLKKCYKPGRMHLRTTLNASWSVLLFGCKWNITFEYYNPLGPIWTDFEIHPELILWTLRTCLFLMFFDGAVPPIVFVFSEKNWLLSSPSFLKEMKIGWILQCLHPWVSLLEVWQLRDVRPHLLSRGWIDSWEVKGNPHHPLPGNKALIRPYKGMMVVTVTIP